VEYEYNRRIHSEIGQAPVTRFLAGPEVTRPCPDSATLKLAFTCNERRTLRRSDGTIVIEGRRFEVPSRYRHLACLEVRFAGWDLSLVHLADEHTGTVLYRLFPQDKTANASGLRRSLEPVGGRPSAVQPAGGMTPLLAALLEKRAATGLPPAYLVKGEGEDE
jgi:putative transposase